MGSRIAVLLPLLIVVATVIIFTDQVSAWYNTKTTVEDLYAAGEAVKFDGSDRWAPRILKSLNEDLDYDVVSTIVVDLCKLLVPACTFNRFTQKCAFILQTPDMIEIHHSVTEMARRRRTGKHYFRRSNSLKIAQARTEEDREKMKKHWTEGKASPFHHEQNDFEFKIK